MASATMTKAERQAWEQLAEAARRLRKAQQRAARRQYGKRKDRKREGERHAD
jgi:hypothetical protein